MPSVPFGPSDQSLNLCQSSRQSVSSSLEVIVMTSLSISSSIATSFAQYFSSTEQTCSQQLLHRLKIVFHQLHHAGGFKGGVLPGHVTLYFCPHKFYGFQIRMIGRESQTVMPMLPQDIVRHTLAGAFEFYRSEEAQKYEEKNTSK